MQGNNLYVAAGPTVQALPETDSQFHITGSVATQLITIAIDGTLPWKAETGANMQIFMGEPREVTRNFFAGPWRYAGQILQSATAPYTVNPTHALVLGQKITMYGRIVRADGRVSEPFTYTFIVGA